MDVAHEAVEVSEQAERRSFWSADNRLVQLVGRIPLPLGAKLLAGFAVAVQMALQMREAMTALTGAWRKRGHELDFSIGVALGYATIGRIGFEGRYDYGAVGSVLNLASRLCDASEPGQIVISRRVLAEVKELVEAKALGGLNLKGLGRPVEAFAVTAAIPART